MFSKNKNKFLKEKPCVHFPKRMTLTMPMRAQKIKSMNKQITQSTLSMKAKIKSKPILVFSNEKENDLSNQKKIIKPSKLNFQPITRS